jgi:hypothetical protein
MQRNAVLTGLIAVCAACVITTAGVCSQSPRTSNKPPMETAMATINLRYIVDYVNCAIDVKTKVTEQLACVRYLSSNAQAALYFYAHLGFALDLTAGRARSLVGAVVGLISLVIGGLALARTAGRIGTRNGRTGAIVALVLGLIGIVLSVVHLGSSTGGFGTGSGRAGAIVALVLGLIGMNLGGLALARSRRSRSTD